MTTSDATYDEKVGNMTFLCVHVITSPWLYWWSGWINCWLAEGWALHGLTHWGRVTHICVSKLPIIGSDNGLSPGWRQAIIWINAGILLIGPLGTNFNEILIAIHIISLKKIHLKMLSGKWRTFCLGLNVLRLQHCCVYSHLQWKN